MALTPERIRELDDLLSANNGNITTSPPSVAGSLTPQRIAELDQFFANTTPKERTFLEEGARQIGLTGRYIAEGGAALPLMVGDAANSVINLGIEGINKVAGTNVPELGRATDAFSQALTDVGLPLPENAGERVIGDASRAVAGAASGIGIGKAVQALAAESPAAGEIGKSLIERPAIQAVGAATGGTAAGVTRENGGGILAQLTAALFGGLTPAALRSGIPNAFRYGVRGGAESTKNLQNNIATFEAAGTTPTVGQGTENRVLRGIESLLSKTPGGAGPIVNKAEKQAEDLSKKLETIATPLASKTTATTTGRAIEKGVKGEGGFVDKFKQTQERLYDVLDDHIEPSAPVNVANTRIALESLNADIPGAKNVSKFFKNGKIQDIEGALTKDVQSDVSGEFLPYEAVKKLRTVVGREIADNSLVSDVPNSKWKTLYAGLSQDMEATAKEAGPEAEKAWSRANAYTRAGIERIDILNGIVGKDTPEKVFQAAISGTREGATNLRAVMKSIPTDAKDAITANVVRRLGLATPGNQNELGDVFSTQTFLTNWNKLSPDARQALFGRYGRQFQSDMNQISKLTGNLRSGSKVFANPSGTEQAISNKVTATSILLGSLTGQIGLAATAAGGVVGANLLSRLMVKPEFVRWLAHNTKLPATAVPTSINTLIQMGSAKKDNDLTEAGMLLKQVENK